MKPLKEMTKEELLAMKETLSAEYKEAQAKGLKLDMSRGKPGISQLDLSLPMLDAINSSSDMRTVLGNDTRNYGDFDGIGEYFERFVKRPLRNLMMGGNERDKEYYVHEYEESEDET